MKHIKLFALLVCLLASATLATGQDAPLNNGRPGGVQPQQVQQSVPQATTTGDELRNGSDFDIPRERLTADDDAQEDLVFPQDFKSLEDELLNSANMSQLIEQFNALKDLVMDLRDANEELRLENRNMRKSLSACCTAPNLGLSASDAYLMQNTPNPAQSDTQVQYFVPEGLTNAQIEIRDIKGVLIQTFPVQQDGFGKIEVTRSDITPGTYLYYLSVDGEVVDSKVMIIK